MNVAYSSISGLSIIAIEERLLIVDNDLKIYHEESVDDFAFDIKEFVKEFIKQTFNYFKDCMFLQFRTLAFKDFAKSEFMKQVREELKERE